jgi:phosphatidylcholine synthase
VRVKRLRPLNLAMFFAWCALGLVALAQDMAASLAVQAGVAVTAVYLFVIGGVMQLFPTLGQKKE